LLLDYQKEIGIRRSLLINPLFIVDCFGIRCGKSKSKRVRYA